MKYVDGFLLPVPKKNIKDYQRMAAKAGKLWRKYGALQYFECVGEDLNINPSGEYSVLPFPKAMKLKPSETVVFSFIVFKSRAHRDAVNTKVMKDPALAKMPKRMPFDVNRMCYGGFKAIVEQ
jgi:uncharacterized protein YbaA (DUF1428 family)